MSDAKHIMLDIETMSAQTNAAVLSVGMVAFTRDEGIVDRVEFRCELSAMQDLGRHVDAKTIEWWLEQSAEAKGALVRLPRHDTVGAFCLAVARWCDDHRAARFDGRPRRLPMWAKGPSFDIAIMRSLFSDTGRVFPCRYGREYCVRTMLLLAQQNDWADILEMEPETKHGALSDAIHQANQVVEVMRRIKKHGHTPSESAAVPPHQETDQQATT